VEENVAKKKENIDDERCANCIVEQKSDGMTRRNAMQAAKRDAIRWSHSLECIPMRRSGNGSTKPDSVQARRQISIVAALYAGG